MKSLRGPVAALLLAVAVIVVAVILDRGSAESRDAALLIGSIGLWVLLPIAVIWLVVALVLRFRRSRSS